MTAAHSLVFDAILFDMDGTLIDSTPGLYKAWEVFSKDYGLPDPVKVVHEAHGRRMEDTLHEICGITDQSKLLSEIKRFEDLVIEGGPVALPGVLPLIEQLNTSTTPKWTIVTSASNHYAPHALARCSIGLPSAGIVTSNDVPRGKPHPDPYLTGAIKCKVDPSNCLVVEDAISGMKSGRAAGAKVLAVCTSTSRDTILQSDAKPDYIVSDLTKVSAHWDGEKLTVTIDEQIA